MNKDKFCSVCGIVTEMLKFCDCGMTYCFNCVNDADFKEKGDKSTCKKCKDRNLVEDSADAIKTLENENKNLKEQINLHTKTIDDEIYKLQKEALNITIENQRLTKSNENLILTNNNLGIEINRLKNSEELLIEENAELKTEISVTNGKLNNYMNLSFQLDEENKKLINDIKQLEKEKNNLVNIIESNNKMFCNVEQLEEKYNSVLSENEKLKEIIKLKTQHELYISRMSGDDSNLLIEQLKTQLNEAMKEVERLSVEKNMLKLKLSTINFIVGEK